MNSSNKWLVNLIFSHRLSVRFSRKAKKGLSSLSLSCKSAVKKKSPINGLIEYQIIIVLKQTLIYAQASKLNGNSNRSTVGTIVLGFVGNLQGWWNHILTEQCWMEIFFYSKNHIHICHRYDWANRAKALDWERCSK